MKFLKKISSQNGLDSKVDTRSAETVRDRERVGGEGGGDLFNSHIDIVYAIARPRGGGGGGGDVTLNRFTAALTLGCQIA